MKKNLWIMLGLGWFLSVHAQLVITKHDPAANVLNTTDFGASPAVAIPDPVRLINGKVMHVDGSWVAVSGQVKQVHPNEGVRIQGMLEGQYQETDFLVEHLPLEVAEGEVLPPPGEVILVKPAGVYTYSTAGGSTRTIRKYDYGIPTIEPPKSPAEIARENAELEARKKAGARKALKANEEDAATGDGYGLLRMGERYRDGDGVETNLLKARIYFLRAADAGNQDATNELAKLPVPARAKADAGK